MKDTNMPPRIETHSLATASVGSVAPKTSEHLYTLLPAAVSSSVYTKVERLQSAYQAPGDKNQRPVRAHGHST